MNHSLITTIAEFDIETFNYFWELAKTAQNETGIMIVDEFEYWEKYSYEFTDLWFKNFCPEVNQ